MIAEKVSIFLFIIKNSTYLYFGGIKTCAEVQNIQGMLNNQMDEVSKHQHNDLQGMTRNSKFFEKSHFQLRDEEDTQPRIISVNHVTRNSKERDCQSIQGASRNQIDEASNQNDIELQGLTSRITFNNNPHVENDFMDEESDQDWMFCLNKKSI
ncbi:uncharacterized protein LOC142543203 isoform X2 [Primulina tabacum]|uniref:uncharacterized protein LOC142543203 isoform X2 n=1 Tax=Primulina tabacum TaxID=48773 RepID=UPI003F5A4688